MTFATEANAATVKAEPDGYKANPGTTNVKPDKDGIVIFWLSSGAVTPPHSIVKTLETVSELYAYSHTSSMFAVPV